MRQNICHVLVLAGAVLLTADPVAPQSRLGFRGQVRCAANTADPFLELSNVLVVPQADWRQRVLSTRTGSFAFSLPAGTVDVASNRGPLVYLVLPPLGADARSDTVVSETLRISTRIGRRFVRTRQYVTSPIELSGFSCDAIREAPALGPTEQADLLMEWTRRGSIVLDSLGGDLIPLLADVSTGGGSALGMIFRTVGNLLARGVARGTTEVVCRTCPERVVVETKVDTVGVEIGARGKFMSMPFSGLTHGIGFAFAPGPNVDQTPLWNPAGMLFSEKVDLGLRRDPVGFVQGSVIIPVSERLAIGGYYYEFDRDLNLCDFADDPACSDPDGAGPIAPVGVDFDPLADYTRSLVDNGALVLTGDPIENNLALRERVVGLSAALSLHPQFAIGITGKWSDRAVEVHSLRREFQRVAVLPGGTEPALPRPSGPQLSAAADTTFEEAWIFDMLRDTVSTEGVDFDVSALALLSDFRIGVSLMNLVGRTETAWNGTQMTSRSVGIGLAYEKGRLNLGGDARFFAQGPADWALGADLALWNEASMHGGYSDEFSAWSVGASFRRARYTFVHSEALGRRHLFGTRIRF